MSHECCENPWPQRDPHEGGWRCGNCLEPLGFVTKKWAEEQANFVFVLSQTDTSKPAKDGLTDLHRILRNLSRPHGY